ncbi:MAG: hypothetical protein KC713_05640 [Candidatus Omnitrophica bacterium]|nr:hypothetical protein [Candidatus Omnitrophota bacterium]
MDYKHIYRISFVYVTFYFVVFMLMATVGHEQPFNVLIKDVLLNAYRPHSNIILLNTWYQDLNLTVTFLILWGSACASICFHIIFSKLKKERSCFYQGVLSASLFLFMYFSIIQTISIGTYIKVKNIVLAQRTVDEKKQIFFQEGALLAEDIHLRLPGSYQAEMLTDMNVLKDPGMYLHRATAYLLYPIDIRNIHSGPTEVLVMFKKKNAADFVPEDYEIIKFVDENNLIAVKKGLLTR